MIRVADFVRDPERFLAVKMIVSGASDQRERL